MQSASNRRLTLRRPERVLLAALAIFVLAVLFRLVADKVISPPVTVAEPPPAPLESASEETIARWQAMLAENPEHTYAYAQLGLSLLERARVTADPSYYAQAETAFNEALKRDPGHLYALIGQGVLLLARHDFQAALALAEEGHATYPYNPDLLSILVDANVELGRYDEATAALDEMLSIRPGLPAFTRASYIRELHGYTDAAIEAMQHAVEAGVPGTEATLWTQVQLGHLYFNKGDLEQAEATYRAALEANPDYLPAQGGVARVQAARGEHGEAIATYRYISERLPMPEYVIALGELYEVTGRQEEAERQYDLVRAMQQLNASAGMDVDLELALFDADHGADPAQALQRARDAYERRPSLYAADTLAWALYQNEEYEEARVYSDEALRLGTRDASLHYHAGMIAHALGDGEAARTHLQEAFNINPYFSVRHAPHARATLEQLSE
jgi:tetratricopeptide (TPR) repeat protein